MVDPLVTKTGAAAGAGLTEGLQQNARPVASQSDVARFQEALGATPPQGTEQTRPSEALEGLDKLSADLKTAQDNVIRTTSDMGDMGDLLRMQFEVANLTTTQTMVGQVGQKSSQGTQQLLKGQ